MIEPTTIEPSSGFADFVLRQIRCAAARSKLTTNQLEAAAAALSGGVITAEQAILILAECRLEIGAE